MSVFNLGSITLDYFYHVPHLPRPGETLAAHSATSGLGGKGANQSVAIARAGGIVHHIGQIHAQDAAKIALMQQAGVEMSFVSYGDVPTGHAIVVIDEGTGENQILLMPGANHAITPSACDEALSHAKAGDWALTQNETNFGREFLTKAKNKGLAICYSAAPFVKEQVLDILPIVDLLVVNEGEAAALEGALGKAPEAWEVPHLVITKGADGAHYFGRDGTIYQPAENIVPVDSTGAGDTYLGFLLAQLATGADMADAMAVAGKAAAIMVTRHGTADVIPALSEIG